MKNKIAYFLIFFVLLSGCSKTEITTENIDEVNIINNTSTPTSEPIKLPLDGKIICIDAGHGINNSTEKEAIAPNSSEKKRAFVSGTRGKNQTEEELNLLVAKQLEIKLKELGATVHMTRNTHETKLSNIGRAKFANDLSADISIKLHADGTENKSARGISMLVPSNKHITDKIYNESLRAGEFILDEVLNSTGAPDRGVVKRSDLTGFNWSEVPVVLLEMGFMTNPQDDALLETYDYREKIAEGITNGLLKYFG